MEPVRKNLVIRLNPNDNVVVARKDIAAGVEIPEEGFVTKTEVPAGYKVASRDIKKGEPIIKYNIRIGFAKEDTPVGTMMHTHNIVFDHGELDYAFCRDYKPVQLIPEAERATFQGIVRKNGSVGTRNYIAILSDSNCSNTATRMVANHFTPEVLKNYPNVDGVIPLCTTLGCGMEMTGEPMTLLRRTMFGYMDNPNVAGTVVMALGCERNNVYDMFRELGLEEGPMLTKIVMEEVGGTAIAVKMGIEAVERMLPIANDVKRETVSAEHIVLALKCGGSDGFSGLSANPALGRAADTIVRNGGTVILAETPEIFGAEHTLTCRARTPEVAQKLLDRIDWWLEYNKGRDCQINGRVSPGNNKGGIANILEKSLGASKKGGETPLNEVYLYGEKVREKGLVFMDTPGYDPVAATGQVAGGANVMCFTTGRGSCYGCVPVPSIKLASNTPMYQRMVADMDINCGTIIDGEQSLDEVGQEIFEMILKVASGEKTKSEKIGVGADEYVPWEIGVRA